MLPSTFLVINTNDSGPNSLRSAIVQVNKDIANPGIDVIDFHLPGTAPVINLKTDLPVVTHQVLIDGTSQPGYAGSPIVTLKNAGIPGADGIVMRATGAASFSGAVKALKINGFAVGVKVLDSGSSTPGSFTLNNNSISSAAGGDGILIFAGTSSTTAQVTNNLVTTSATGDGIAAYTAGTANSFTFAGNTIHSAGGGDGLRTLGSGLTNTLTFNNNHVFVQTGGDGIVVATGTNAKTTAHFVSNVVNTSGGGDGVALFTAGKSATFTFTSNTVQASGGGDGIRASGNAALNDLTFSANHVFAQNAGDALVLALSPASKTIARVTNNVLNTAGLGNGLFLQGGANFQAIVQGNGFGNNLAGVTIFGNGTTAGTIDLGGGALGSTGGNDFRTFTHATDSSYAIGLFSVAPSYSMTAKNELFSVSPALVMADGAHDPAAGGTGLIIV
jgi:hypothetical protein